MKNEQDINKQRKQYKNLLNERKKILDRINQLEQNDVVKEYNSLLEQNNEKYFQETELYKKIKTYEYENCDHVLVETYTDCESGYGGRTYHYYGCIKCGCNEYVKEKRYYLTEEEKLMLDYIESQTTSKLEGKRLGIYCEDLTSAIKKYNSLIKSNKGLDEDTIIEMFKIYISGSNNRARKRKSESEYTVNVWDVP